jgi:pimeloyl-ACP methyl ester carboxylesterase
MAVNAKYEARGMTSTLVLVHGAWQSVSTWDLVRPKLEQAGWPVNAPGLTGLESSASLTPEVDLATHIEDVVRVVRAASGPVTLVGHSYAGMIITGVAEKVQNITSLIYVDAFVPEGGLSALDLMPEQIGGMLRQRAQADGDGWRLRAGEEQLDLWGLRAGPAREFVRERLTDFSLRCFEQRLDLPGNAAAAIPRTYIAATAEGYPARPVFQRFAEKAQRDGWAYFELPTGHDCHVEMPDTFVQLLVAAESAATASGE